MPESQFEYRMYKDLRPACGPISIQGGVGGDAEIQINGSFFIDAPAGSVTNILVIDRNLNQYDPYLGTPGTLLIAKERRQDWQAPYSYCGYAQYLSNENDNVWRVTRIQVNNNGTTTVGVAYNVNWTNRYTHIYT